MSEDPFEDIFREIERMMNEMVDPAPTAGAEATVAGGGSPTDTHVDVYEDGEEIRVVADLPGVSREQISVQSDGEYVTLRAESDRRQYDERVSLPVPVDPESGSGTYNNGILEVTFERTGGATDIDIE